MVPMRARFLAIAITLPWAGLVAQAPEPEGRNVAPPASAKLPLPYEDLRISRQWWTEDSLLSVIEDARNGGSANPDGTWVIQEHRRTGFRRTLKAPPATRSISFHEGVLWAWTFEFVDERKMFPDGVNTPADLEAVLKARAAQEVGGLYRCDDFSTWDLILSFQPSGGLQFHGVEPLLDGRVFLFGTFPTRKGPVAYATGTLSSDRRLTIDHAVEIAPEEGGRAQFGSSVRTPRHIVSYSKELGRFRVFDGKTGSFERSIRCWPSQGDDTAVPPNHGVLDDIILGVSVMPDGKLLVASRDSGFAKALNDRTPIAKPRSRKAEHSKAAVLADLKVDIEAFQKRMDGLNRDYPDVVWRTLDLETGTWSPVPAPTGALGRIRALGDILGFQFGWNWDGSPRN